MTINKGSIAIVAVAFATAVHAAARVYIAHKTTVAPPSELNGKRLVTVVHQANRRDSTALSDVAPNRCVYLVVTEPSCTGGKIGANDWARVVASEHNRPDIPDEWFVGWISTDDSVSMESFYPKGFPFPQLYTARGTLNKELRFATVPSYIIMDRHGKVVDANGGPMLPKRDQFKPNCSIVWNPSAKGGLQ